jgi:hypothetical protein
MFKRWLVVVGLWLARQGGWVEAQHVVYIPATIPVSDALIASAKEMVVQTEKMPGGGEFKRREALRAMMNRHPDLPVKDLALAIEYAVR